MKIQPRQIEAFLKKPDPSVRVVLVYGPDNGLMKERVAKLGKTVVDDLNDPFNVAILSGDILTEDPARLSDEANAQSMMGGDRLIRIENASDKLTVLLKAYLEAPSNQALVLVEADNLTPSSSLRKLCEKEKNAAALPCYVEDQRGLMPLIRDSLRYAGYDISPDALAWLATNIQGDRGRVRNELDKLVTYMGPDKAWEGEEGPPVPNRLGIVQLDDVQACSGEAGAQSLDDLVYAVADRRTKSAMMSFQKLLAEGLPTIAILRALQNHFRRLHLVRSKMQEGQSLEQAVKSLRPPVFFKQERPFKAQAQNWGLLALNGVLTRLAQLEAQCKTSGAPAETLCAQAILSLSVKRAG